MNDLIIPVEQNYIDLMNYLAAIEGIKQPRQGLIIAIDGVDGIGKTTLAAFLSWQLGMPYLPLDEFMVKGDNPFSYNDDLLKNVILSRLDDNLPVIVEGVFALEALVRLGFRMNLLIRVILEKKDGTYKTMTHIEGGKLESLHKDYMDKFAYLTPDYTFRRIEQT